jgi:hypothetical protein
MSRISLPLYADDISAFARALNQQLTQRGQLPGHVELLNMLARSAGCRNFQHFRAQTTARDKLDHPRPAPVIDIDYVLVERVARYFDATGRLMRWPGKGSHRELCLWVLCSKWPPRIHMAELEVNEFLKALHLFQDHAILRRLLSDYGMVVRTPDGKIYRRVEQAPPANAAALIRHVALQKAG